MEGQLDPKAVGRLVKELKDLESTPPEGIRVLVNEDNFSEVNAEITGPGMLSFGCSGLCAACGLASYMAHLS
jgi:hypothetical protein